LGVQKTFERESHFTLVAMRIVAVGGLLAAPFRALGGGLRPPAQLQSRRTGCVCSFSTQLRAGDRGVKITLNVDRSANSGIEF
jgi:hypothetical protein